MIYIDPNAAKEKKEYSSALEEFKSLFSEHSFSINPSFFDLYPDLSDYWKELSEGVAKSTPLIFNGCTLTFEYFTKLNLLINEIEKKYEESFRKLRNIPEKIMYVETQKYYFQKVLIDLEPIMRQFLDGSHTKISESLPAHFQVRIPNEILVEYKIDEDFQFHIEEECPLWFFHTEYGCLTHMLELLAKTRDQLMILKLAEISDSEAFQQAPDQKNKNREDQPMVDSNPITGIKVSDENQKRVKSHKHIDKLDIRQTVLLFHYLREHGLILDHSNLEMAKLVGALTGFSQQNLRSYEGGFEINKLKVIIEDHPDGKLPKFSHIKNHNLQTVKRALEELIDSLEDQIAVNANKSIGEL